jgi:hypothetical protein
MCDDPDYDPFLSFVFCIALLQAPEESPVKWEYALKGQ